MGGDENDLNNLLTSSAFPRKRGRSSKSDSPRSSRTDSPRKAAARNSPRRIISRLPVRSNGPIEIPELRLPPDDSIVSISPAGQKVTPEKLIEQLRNELKSKRMRKEIKPATLEEDDEISLSIPYYIESLKISEDQNQRYDYKITSDSIKPRMSLRNRGLVIEAPDLDYEDPLEIARQTLQNTRANTGYRHCKLVYTTEKRSQSQVPSSSPEPAFSKKTGVTRHFLEDDGFEEHHNKKIKFNRVLKLIELETDDFEEGGIVCPSDNFNLKPCLKQQSKKLEASESDEAARFNAPSDLQNNSNSIFREIVHIKRIYYEDLAEGGDEDDNSSPTKRRKLSGAKRLKKID